MYIFSSKYKNLELLKAGNSYFVADLGSTKKILAEYNIDDNILKNYYPQDFFNDQISKYTQNIKKNLDNILQFIKENYKFSQTDIIQIYDYIKELFLYYYDDDLIIRQKMIEVQRIIYEKL